MTDYLQLWETFEEFKKCDNLEIVCDLFILNKYDMDEKELEGNTPSIQSLQTECSHAWKIDDNVLIKKILTSNVGQYFQSHILPMAGMLWMIIIYPNGESHSGSGSFCVYVTPVYLHSSFKTGNSESNHQFIGNSIKLQINVSIHWQ